MLVLRAVLLELLVCFYVIGGAVIFRRLFPRESPWLAFIVPTLAVMALFNFIEHFIALPNLSWLFPISLGGLLWAVLRPGYSWEGMRFPSILFLAVFTWDLFIRCMNPEITCNTEGVADMARVLDFCLGGTLPAIDTWCPPYDHGGYYAFQHYGASLLKRLFSLDIGTGYNMGYNLLNTLTVLVGAGAAYRLSGNRKWVAVATLLVLLANFTGSAVYLLLSNPLHPDFRLSTDIGDGWSDPGRHNPFGWIFAPYLHIYPNYNPPTLRLFTPAFNTYFPEFHANLGGHFMTLATLLAAHEAYRTERSNWPWICLLVFPLITIIMSTWFFLIVTALCGGCFVVALIASRRPESWKFVLLGAILGSALIWPSVDTLLSGNYPTALRWTLPVEHAPFWEFVIQWWPIIVPWFFLCFVWRRLSLMARWIHAAIPLLLIFVEYATFGDRGITIEKMWGAIYGASLVTFLPLVFVQSGLAFRFLTGVFFCIVAMFMVAWVAMVSQWGSWQYTHFHLQGDTIFQYDNQKKRLLQVLKRLHGVTVLPGKSAWSYNQAPSIIGFSENRCYIAWYAQEYQCGHGGESEYRDQMTNDFYAGKMSDPLPFLRSNDIAAVLIWPEDNISDDLLAQFQEQLGTEYYYVDCRQDGSSNAGLFIRQTASPSFPVLPVLSPLPSSPPQ